LIIILSPARIDREKEREREREREDSRIGDCTGIVAVIRNSVVDRGEEEAKAAERIPTRGKGLRGIAKRVVNGRSKVTLTE